MAGLELRGTVPNDLPQIFTIERLSYPTPWDLQTFLSVLGDENCHNVTALEDRRIVGYSFTEVMTRMVHVLNLAVHPDFRRKGIARSLLDEVISFGRSLNKSYVFLEVRRNNESARALYDSMGFTHACTWRHYYTDSGEDACIMVRKIEDPE